MSDLSDAHNRAKERGRNDAINLVPLAASPYKKSEHVWAWHGNRDGAFLNGPLNTVGNGEDHSLSGMRCRIFVCLAGH
jgi:hypothetical protein